MKKILIICLAVLFCFCGCTANSAEAENTIPKEITASYSPDYTAIDVYHLYNISDLVVRVTYNKDIGMYAGNSWVPVTLSEFTVISVLKGEYSEEIIEAEYTGGTCSLYETKQKMPESMIKPLGYDKYSDEESKEINITFGNNEYIASFNTDSEYLLLLNYDDANGLYVVGSDIYSAPEITDGKVYNKNSNEYVDLNTLADGKPQ